MCKKDKPCQQQLTLVLDSLGAHNTICNSGAGLSASPSKTLLSTFCHWIQCVRRTLDAFRLMIKFSNSVGLSNYFTVDQLHGLWLLGFRLLGFKHAAQIVLPASAGQMQDSFRKYYQKTGLQTTKVISRLSPTVFWLLVTQRVYGRVGSTVRDVNIKPNWAWVTLRPLQSTHNFECGTWFSWQKGQIFELSARE